MPVRTVCCDFLRQLYSESRAGNLRQYQPLYYLLLNYILLPRLFFVPGLGPIKDEIRRSIIRCGCFF
jgi:hypothetical protein